MRDAELQQEAADVIAFMDEAGPRGYLRALKPEADDGVSVLCALLIPAEHVDKMRDAIRPAYNMFCTAAPTGAKIHITDAFRTGNEKWAAVAKRLRDDLFEFMIRAQCQVVYAARRLRIARETFEMKDNLKRSFDEVHDAQGPFNIIRNGAKRPSDEQVDDRLMKDFILLVDAFVEVNGRRQVDFHFDEITDHAAQRFRSFISDLRQTGNKQTFTRYRNLSRGENFTRSFRMTTECKSDSGFRLAIKHVGNIKKTGKSDPMILAADILTNSLWRHLSGLNPSANLNDTSALVEWPLASIVFGESQPGASQMDRM